MWMNIFCKFKVLIDYLIAHHCALQDDVVDYSKSLARFAI